jgi:LysM repeat protein
MDDEGATTALRSSAPPTLTPAVVGASAFVALCAIVSIAFVAARGGLELPLASASAAPVAVASPAATAASPSGPPTATQTPAPTAAPSAASPSPSPATEPTPEPTPTGPTPTPDPLTALPPCPDHPGCYVYTVRRDDTLSRIARRYDVPLSTVVALNPELVDPSVVVLGQPIYLGRDPYARLDPCPNRDGCYLYVVRPGDRLTTIAARFGISLVAILELNPAIDDPSTIFSGQVIRLPRPTT